MLFVERVLQLRIDHIIRRRDDITKRADVAQVIADSAKGLDVGHGRVKSGESRVESQRTASRAVLGPEIRETTSLGQKGPWRNPCPDSASLRILTVYEGP